MNPDTLDILTRAPFMTIATTCEDGSPWVTPLSWFAFDRGQNRILFDCRRETTHGQNLARDARCAISLVIQRDGERPHSVNIKTLAKKLPDAEHEQAKSFIINSGDDKNVEGEVFAANIGDFDEGKTRPGRFYYYVNKEEKK